MLRRYHLDSINGWLNYRNLNIFKIKDEDDSFVYGDSEHKPLEEKKYHWIYATNKKLDKQQRKINLQYKRTGKWLIFIHQSEINDKWEIIKENVENNNLGISAKVSTSKPSMKSSDYRVICIYNYDFQDTKDIMKARRVLWNLGFKQPLCYKTDDSTKLGRYKHGSHLYCDITCEEKSLDISERKIEGKLNLTQFNEISEIDRLNCSNNKITDLDLSECNSLREIVCRKSSLKNLDWINTIHSPEKITKLDLGDNLFLEGNLEPLKKLTNLIELNLSGGLLKNNKISLSLSFLINLERLKILNISKTSLEDDIESLPINLETIYAGRVTKIESKLKDFGKSESIGYDYQAWRNDNQELIQQSRVEIAPK
ncbi:MAG: hypothetical protein mread185_000224 [Mycoplasmataceae bacterium]|nr:MAG: hypothetical protein mread185_000224 [Mycoplasmataceae bacterium]